MKTTSIWGTTGTETVEQLKKVTDTQKHSHKDLIYANYFHYTSHHFTVSTLALQQ